jgi:ribonuclease HI
MIEAWFDGVCEPRNPGGHAAYGALVKADGEVVLSEGVYVGHGSKMSNNVAEYSAMIAVLRKLATLQDYALVRGDSMLVINQLRGTWEVHGGLYVPYYREAFKLFDPIRGRVALEWIPRERNSECDVLSKQVLLDRGIRFRIQPGPGAGAGDMAGYNDAR